MENLRAKKDGRRLLIWLNAESVFILFDVVTSILRVNRTDACHCAEVNHLPSFCGAIRVFEA